ncbi:hypothetical protein HZB78_03180 [Candidatus Collierbacteria bacterium]|nr:hypothetical protein [Candidatus Collierbacteria bacterium]
MDDIDKQNIFPRNSTDSQSETAIKTVAPPLLSGLKVAIIYSDAKREYFATEEHYLTEAEVFDRVKLIIPYLEKMGAKVTLLPGDNNLGNELRKLNPAFTLNLVDSVRGDESLAPSIPGLLELLDLSYTGSGILGMSINYNKFLTKKLMEQHGLPVPRYQLMNAWTDNVNPLLRYPLISKLNSIHGSVEIDDTAVAENERQLRDRVKHLMTTYKDDVLVEEFIAGRELSAVIFEGMKRKVYVGEKVFHDTAAAHYKIASFTAVWKEDELDPSQWSYHYEKYEPNDQLKDDMKKAFEVLKMEDYAKLDIRLDSSGRYYFIDPNANPAFGPKESFCALGTIMDLYGIDFNQILRRLAINTLNGSLIQAGIEAAL